MVALFTIRHVFVVVFSQRVNVNEWVEWVATSLINMTNNTFISMAMKTLLVILTQCIRYHYLIKMSPQQTFVIIHNIIVKMLKLDIGNQTTTVLRKEGENCHTACVYALPLAISLSWILIGFYRLLQPINDRAWVSWFPLRMQSNDFGNLEK